MKLNRGWQEETEAEFDKVPSGTVAAQSMALGRVGREPLLVAMDAMLRYAKAYRKAFDSPVGDDGFLGSYYTDAISGVRGLLNGDGAVAMERGISTDSKDNGVIESLYWHCCREAGLDGDNL